MWVSHMSEQFHEAVVLANTHSSMKTVMASDMEMAERSIVSSV